MKKKRWHYVVMCKLLCEAAVMVQEEFVGGGA